MKTIIFDVDDTLYDQQFPFKKALEETFQLTLSTDEVNQLYLASRKHSDDLFEQEQAGEISTLKLQTYRITEACRDYNISITYDEAVAFQTNYLARQKEITLFKEVEQLLDYLKAQNKQLAVLTNGGTEHQTMKIKQLGLSKWIPESHFFISGTIGHAKPKKDPFLFIEEQLQLDPSKTIYIGDAFVNDIIGAKQVGWKAIWFNHRKRKPEDDEVKPDFEARTPAELLNFFKIT